MPKGSKYFSDRPPRETRHSETEKSAERPAEKALRSGNQQCPLLPEEDHGKQYRTGSNGIECGVVLFRDDGGKRAAEFPADHAAVLEEKEQGKARIQKQHPTLSQAEIHQVERTEEQEQGEDNQRTPAEETGLSRRQGTSALYEPHSLCTPVLLLSPQARDSPPWPRFRRNSKASGGRMIRKRRGGDERPAAPPSCRPAFPPGGR